MNTHKDKGVEKRIKIYINLKSLSHKSTKQSKEVNNG
jgi:hypothetical protein